MCKLANKHTAVNIQYVEEVHIIQNKETIIVVLIVKKGTNKL